MNNKIIIQKTPNDVYEIHSIVELLQFYGISNEKINRNAYLSHFSQENFRNFKFVGYQGFATELAKEVLTNIGAVKHLAYVNGENSLSFKKIAAQENLFDLHCKWLAPLVENVTFKEKWNYYSKLIGTDIMPVNQETLKSYAFLKNWTENYKMLDLNLLSLQVYGDLEPYNSYFVFPDSDVDHTRDGIFVSFGVDGSGGHYLLWYYPNMKKEPSVVYISFYGEMEYLYSSLNAYILSLLNEIVDEFEEYVTGHIEDLTADYNERFNKNISEKEGIVLLKEDLIKFTEQFNNTLSVNEYDDYDKVLFEKLIKRWKLN